MNVQHFTVKAVSSGISIDDAVEMMNRALSEQSVIEPSRSHTGWVRMVNPKVVESPISYTRTTAGDKTVRIQKGEKVKAVAIIGRDGSGRPVLYSASYEKAKRKCADSHFRFPLSFLTD